MTPIDIAVLFAPDYRLELARGELADLCATEEHASTLIETERATLLHAWRDTDFHVEIDGACLIQIELFLPATAVPVAATRLRLRSLDDGTVVPLRWFV